MKINSESSQTSIKNLLITKQKKIDKKNLVENFFNKIQIYYKKDQESEKKLSLITN